MVDTVLLHTKPIVSNFFEETIERFRLTKREGQVLQLLSLKGTSYRELGDELNLSEKTLKNHVANIQAKFNVKSSREIQAVVFRDFCLSQ